MFFVAAMSDGWEVYGDPHWFHRIGCMVLLDRERSLWTSGMSLIWECIRNSDPGVSSQTHYIRI